MRRPLIFALTLGAAFWSSAALAQNPRPASGVGPTDTDKVKQVFVYGDDPCPKGEADEILVCARMPDNERYRIPADLRTDPNDPKVQSWANRAIALEHVGSQGIDTCSPAGASGFSGCFAQISSAAREERRTMLGSATWADAVAKARNERLGNLDAESAQIEAGAVQDEADEAARKKAADEAAAKAANPSQGPADPQ